MAYLYLADISNLPDPAESPELLDRLPKERQDKIGQLKQAKNRIQSLGAGLLLHEVCQKHGVDDRMCHLGEYGKPEIDGFHFNLSHSGELVACAVGSEPIGCDIEKVRKAPEHLAERFFCESEIQHLAAFQGTDYDEEFFRLWTMKESYIKMTGKGMHTPLHSFEVIPGVPSFKEKVVQNYKVTVCTNECEIQGPIWVNI